MSYLFDTNCFLRLVEKKSPQRNVVLESLRKLRSRGERICYTPQVLAEFWNVCTRPAAHRGGFDLSVQQTERKVALIEKHFELLPDNLDTFLHWRKLVAELGVSGVQVHDAKLVASMIAHKMQYLVTLNDADFKRFSMIKVIHPQDV